MLRLSCKLIDTLGLTDLTGVGEKSSHYGLDMLGYTCATKAKTMGRDNKN